ncbi:hypothetical protein R1flu_018534 [Riccia fluitans]|uniref:HTH CENPB-type domain-containing protein n=1 Tax=Riccia fluitans TaxID=41844 RepID=A0ABD1ZIE0_9MARC
MLAGVSCNAKPCWKRAEKTRRTRRKVGRSVGPVRVLRVRPPTSYATYRGIEKITSFRDLEALKGGYRPRIVSPEKRGYIKFFRWANGKSTVSRILKKKEKYLSGVFSQASKREKASHVPHVEKILYRWFLAALEQRTPTSDDLLIKKAKMIHEQMSEQEVTQKSCNFSHGWLDGFKKRHGIRQWVTQGESKSVVMTDEIWEKFTAVKASLAEYEAQDIFSMDETGLFYKLLPNRTLADQQISGARKHKDRITVVLTANMDGSIKLPPLVINYCLRPRAFTRRNIKNPDNLGITWHANKDAWMTRALFEHFLLQFDSSLLRHGRKKVLLLVDNAPSHIFGHLTDQLKVTKVVFLPPRTSSRFQPMDAGIIQSFKCEYRKLMISKQIAGFEAGEVGNMDVYDAVVMLEKAWRSSVTTKTIQNCWKHCSLVPDIDQKPKRDLDLNANVEDQDLNAQMQEIASLLEVMKLKFPVNMTVEDYLNIDNTENAPTCELPEGALELVVPDGNSTALELQENENGEEEASSSVDLISYKDVQYALDIVKIYLAQQVSDTTEETKKILSVSSFIEKNQVDTVSQSTMDQSFANEYQMVRFGA